MSKPKHTPGPWKRDIKFTGTSRFEYDIVASGSKPDLKYRICSLTAYHDIQHEVDANIALISAAPELLEALKRLADVANNQTEDSLAAAIDQAYDAIDKAEREE